MLKNQAPKLCAIAVIIFVGTLYQSQIIGRVLALCIAILAFALAQGYSCYTLKRREESWQREAGMGVLFILIIAILLFL